MGGGPQSTDPTAVTEPAAERGFTVVSAMWVMAVTLVLVLGFTNLFIQRYAQAVVRQATDEGARAWAVNGGTAADCEAAAADVLDDLLAGTIGDQVSITCADTGATISVTASAVIRGMPPMPDADFVATSVVAKELEEDLELP